MKTELDKNEKLSAENETPPIANVLLAAVVGDATHLLRCRHCIGRSCKEYFMACIQLGKSKNGKLKVLVFGDRNWAGRDDRKRVRYVEDWRVISNGC